MNNSRLEFATRHFVDLQTIRFAPLPIAMVLGPLAAYRIPQLSRPVAWALVLDFLLLAAAFYRWSTAAIRRRYGSVRLSREESFRMQSHPVIVALNVVLVAAWVWLRFYGSRTNLPDLYIAFSILLWMLPKILDPTNLANRRIAWAIGMVVLFFTAGLFLLNVNGGAIALAGAVLLSLSVYDFLLLRRTFAEISTGSAPAETLVRRG